MGSLTNANKKTLIFWYQRDYLRSPAKNLICCRVSTIGTDFYQIWIFPDQFNKAKIYLTTDASTINTNKNMNKPNSYATKSKQLSYRLGGKKITTHYQLVPQKDADVDRSWKNRSPENHRHHMASSSVRFPNMILIHVVPISIYYHILINLDMELSQHGTPSPRHHPSHRWLRPSWPMALSWSRRSETSGIGMLGFTRYSWLIIHHLGTILIGTFGR